MIKSVLRGMRRQLKSDVLDLCQLEANESQEDFALSSGGFCTFYEVLGSYGAVSEDGAEWRLNRLADLLGASMRAPGTRLQFVFSRVPDLAEHRIRDALDPTLRTARRLHIGITEMLEDRMDALSGRISEERCLLVLSTLPESLTDVERKAAKGRMAEMLRKFNLPASFGEYAMSPYLGLADLRRTHDANRRMIESSFQGICGLQAMPCDQAMLALRAHIAHLGAPKWRPRLLGGKPSMRILREVDDGMDGSCLFTPTIAHQLFTDPPEAKEGLVRLGDRWHGTLSLDMLPASPVPFDALFQAVPGRIPWQVSITLTSGHEAILKRLKLKETLASVIAWTESGNRLILNALTQLQHYAGESTLVACQVQAATSGSSPEQVRERTSVLVRALESWGGPSVMVDRGDPVEGWLSAQPGYTESSISPPCAAPIGDALSLCPVLRPRPPWRRGGSLLRTIDNRLFPVAQGSSQQALSADLVFAPPGAGKSLKLAADNLSMLCDAANETLPRIAIIDVGYSAKLFIDLVKEVLPPEKSHMAQSFTFRLEESASSVNPLDTPLGCRRPPAMDRAWMISFLTLLFSPASAERAPERLAEFISQAIDETFDHFAPTPSSSPKEYDPGASPEVDAAIERIGLPIVDGRTSWWAVVDGLFKAGEVLAATLAQRYAVPTLHEIPQALNASKALRDLAEDIRIGGESPITYLTGMINLAIRDNPSLDKPSSFAVSEARIVAVDLSQVAQGGSGRGDKQTALYYLLARQMLCSGYYLDEDSIADVPALYRDHHLLAIREDKRAAKRICYDEFHRTRRATEVREQVVRDIREGRKYGVRVCLISQLLEDFDDDMVELATNIWIMGQPTSQLGIKQIGNRFAPSPDAMDAYQRHVTGPSREGSSMLYLAKLDSVSERVEQVLRLTLGATEIWAYSTTPKDVELRREVVRRMGFAAGIKRLAERFPGGTAAAWIEAQDEGEGSDLGRLADLLVLRDATEDA